MPTFKPDRKLPDTIRDNRDRRIVIRERSVNDYAAAMAQRVTDHADGDARRPKGSKLKCGTSSLAAASSRDDFYGGVSIENYRDMLRDGWRDGVKHPAKFNGLCSDAAETVSFERNVGGAFPLVPAYLAGDPCNMLDPRMQRADRVRSISLVIDACFSGGVHSSTVLKYAETVMQFVAWLEAEQVETAVYIVLPNAFHGSTTYLYCTAVREAGRVMQAERIAALVHPCFLRRAWFAMLEIEAINGDATASTYSCGGYGQVVPVPVNALSLALPYAESIALLPKPGEGDPTKAIDEIINLKLRRD